MTPGELSIITDSIKDIKHWKSLLDLMSSHYAQINPELSETLGAVYEHLSFALGGLENLVK